MKNHLKVLLRSVIGTWQKILPHPISYQHLSQEILTQGLRDSKILIITRERKLIVADVLISHLLPFFVK